MAIGQRVYCPPSRTIDPIYHTGMVTDRPKLDSTTVFLQIVFRYCREMQLNINVVFVTRIQTCVLFGSHGLIYKIKLIKVFSTLADEYRKMVV